MSDQLSTEQEIREYMAELIRLGIPRDEVLARLDALTQGPLAPEVEEAIEFVPKGQDPGWWKSPAGWIARLRLRKWEARQRDAYRAIWQSQGSRDA